MSSASPSRGLRAKTSDLTDFFRGGNHSSLQTRQSHNDISTATRSSMGLEVPSSCDEGTGPVKKKITRIPLFGRSRKKSNQSASSSPFVSSGGGRYSSEVGELSSASRGPSTDRRPSEPPISIQPPPLPTSKPHNSSLTSKFAARFSHSRPSKAVDNQTDSASVKPAAHASSSGLQPPGTRSSSIESGSSNGTKSRSATPRPAPTQPTIMISLTADDYEEYKDLFSRPGDETPTTIRAPRQRHGPESDAPLASTSTSTRSPGEPSTYRRGQTPAAAIAAAVRHRHTSSIDDNERTPSPPQKNTKSPSDRKSHERNDGSSIPRAYDTTRESPRPSEIEKNLPPSLQRRGSVAVSSVQSSDSAPHSTRSRMKLSSSPSRSRPPSIPLPLPPTPPLPASPPPVVPPSPATRHPKTDSTSSFTSSRGEGSSRPRAHTISSGVNPLRPNSRLSRSTTVKPPTPPIPPLVREKEGFNIETASPNELRQALRERNMQYDELATFVLNMTEAHIAEVTGLEKKINNFEKKVASLESEVLKQEKTIQGMIHIIKEQDEKQQQQEQEPKQLPPSAFNNSRFAPSGADSDQEAHKSGPPAMRRRLNYHSDSGGESHATSGAESVRASGGSGTDSLSSIFRSRKLRRPYPLGDSAYVASRTGSLLRSSKLPPAAGPPEKSLPDVPPSSSSNPKRSSMSSMSPSPSSSTSSLLPPSPSITMSSLSAIPEGLASSLRPPRHGGSEPAEERRTTYSNRASTSSMTSSSTAASSSYSAHIKRSRPPSIAQVLEKSPKTDNVLDKLRPFS